MQLESFHWLSHHFFFFTSNTFYRQYKIHLQIKEFYKKKSVLLPLTLTYITSILYM